MEPTRRRDDPRERTSTAPSPSHGGGGGAGGGERERTRDRERDRTAGGGGETDRDRERERIGNYYLGNEIGRGSFATVFKGYRVKTRAPIAIKAVSRNKLTPKLLENLEGEINILKAISHPRVVELEDCIKNDHHIYLIMAFCSGGDLSLYIKKRGRLSTLDYLPFEGAKEKVFWPHPKEGGLDGRVARCFLGQLADALQFLRARNLIHRDIKPQNLLLHPPSEQDYAAGHPLGIPLLKVADFGFARILPAATLAETLCGSPLYMAPEILRYEKYDAKADLWSVGAVLFEMVVGRPPFRAQNHVELLRKIERGEDKIKFPDERSQKELDSAAAAAADANQPPPPEAVPVAEDIKTLIRKLLKRVPVQRMSFEEFFACGVWEGYMKVVPPAPPVATPALDLSRNASSSSLSRQGAYPAAPANQRKISEPKYFVPTPTPPASEVTTRQPSPRMAHARPIDIRARTASESGTPVEQASLPNTQDKPTVRRYSSMRNRPGLQRESPTPEIATPSSQDVIAMGRDRQAMARPSTSPAIAGLSTSASRHDTRTMSSQAGLQDSMLGDQYVVVDKRNLEVNAMADEVDAMSRKPDGLVRRRSSRLSALTRPMSALATGAAAAGQMVASSSSPVSYSPPFALSSTPPFAIAGHQRAPSLHSMASSPTLNTRATRPILVPHSATTYGANMTYQQAAQEARYSESPPAGTSLGIARALSMAAGAAGMRWLGSPVNAIGTLSRKPWLRSRQPITYKEDDLGEESLLQDLEDLSQKAVALCEFANAKLSQCVMAPKLSTSGAGQLLSGMSPHPGAAAYPYQGSFAARRRSSSGSTSSADLSIARIETLCAEALVLYLKALAFLQFGVEKAKRFWDDKAAVSDVVHSSPEFNESVQWFRNRFNDCFEKAEWAKSRCPEDMPESASYVERLIYDKAIELSRAAAVTELVGEDLPAAEQGYENALWLLQALLDTILLDGQEMPDGDKIRIENVLNSVKVRLDALRRKVALIQSSATPVVAD